MPTILRIEMIIVAISMLLIVITIVKKGKISIKYSMVWIGAGLLLLLFVLFPTLLELISEILGFKEASNMIFLIVIGILFFITLSLTIIVSNLKEKTILLTQELSKIKSNEKNKK